MHINGAILQRDEGVLVSNRIDKIIPIIDEVELIEKIPIGAKCVIEVAASGKCIQTLSNPYGIAKLFNLTPEETNASAAIARALIGIRSAVVIKTPNGEIKERVIPAGALQIYDSKQTYNVDVSNGAEAIMQTVEKCKTIQDVRGTMGTNVGGMIEKIRGNMSNLTGEAHEDIRINDLFAVDTVIPQEVKGSIAKEFFMEHAVGIAAMVRTNKNQMEKVAVSLSEELNINTQVGGVEAEMAVLGALTTPGTSLPMVIVDIGAGSTDVCYQDVNGNSKSVHLAGAGNMITMMINAELGLEDMYLAENIKKYPIAQVESFYHIRHENGTIQFFDVQLPGEYYGKKLIVTEHGYIPLETEASVDKICSIRKRAKKAVIVRNIVRGLKMLSPTGTPSYFSHVVLVGGSSLDFEIGNMVTDELGYFGITAGKADIRGCEGPRNAVATGLILSRKEDCM